MTVTLSNGGIGDGGAPITATTDASGGFSFANEPIGAYTVAFARTGFTAKSVQVGTSVAGPTILAVTMAADTTAGVDAPTFQLNVSSTNGLSDPFAVGFGTTVTVSVANLTDTNEPTLDASTFTYGWKLSTAPTPINPSGKYSWSGTPPTSTSTSATFTTQTLMQTKSAEGCQDCGWPTPYIARLGVVGINPDETGRYTVAVTVSDAEGHNYTFSQGIRSTWQLPGVADVPLGTPVYVQGDTFAAPNWLQQNPTFWKWANDSWAWTFKSCVDSSGTTITCPSISDASTQFPHFVLASGGTYTLQVVESSSAALAADAGVTGLGADGGPGPGGTYGSQTSTLTIYAGQWLGVMNGNPAATCEGNCHHANGIAPDKFTPWENTAHQSAMQRKVDGLATSHFNDSCLECHTTGWDEVATAQTAANGGFFYEQSTEKNVIDGGGPWQYPNPMTSTSYSDMVASYPTLGYLGGIQCENCHGPASGPAANHPGNGTGDPALKLARIDWSSQVCGSCHQEANTHYYPGQWGVTKHSNVQVAIQRATVESKATTALGGADPQSGAQFCARCHSGQGFAEYVNLLNNGATGRYDFITTNDQKLAADGGNAPTVAYLQSLGLTASQVQPQTCQTCHDPHSNGAFSAAYGSDAGAGPVDCSQQANYASAACKQLRVYDGLPGLPNGLGAFAGVGEGALCMTCHNGRNGEHTDTVNSSPYVETPHDSTAAEAMFGFDAFFVPRFSPSPHLAITDTCVGCHVKLPTAAETDAGLTNNHSFATDLSICQNCHGSSSVSGAAIQAQVQSEMTQLGTAITGAVSSAIKAAAANGLCVQVTGISDPKCTGGTCKSSQVVPAVPFPVPLSNVSIPATGSGLPGAFSAVKFTNAGSTSATITVTSALAAGIPYYDVTDIHMASPVGTTTTLTSYSVSIYTIQSGVCGSTTGYVFPTSNTNAPGLPDNSVPGKAIWNYVTLSNEGSMGIHNFPWTNAVIQNTMAQLNAWKP